MATRPQTYVNMEGVDVPAPSMLRPVLSPVHRVSRGHHRGHVRADLRRMAAVIEGGGRPRGGVED